MEKRSLVIVSIAIVLLGAGWGFHVLTSKSEKAVSQVTSRNEKVVNVDDVVSDPEKFSGVLGVEGTVTKVDEANSAFTLGCEDACILMPVKFSGHLPHEGASVIAYGEVKKTEEAKYIFIAQEIKAK